MTYLSFYLYIVSLLGIFLKLWDVHKRRVNKFGLQTEIPPHLSLDNKGLQGFSK